jgi:thioredoxin-related protein
MFFILAITSKTLSHLFVFQNQRMILPSPQILFLILSSLDLAYCTSADISYFPTAKYLNTFSFFCTM